MPAEKSDLRLAELIVALSLATDLGTGLPMEHALRSCLLAVRLAGALGLPAGEIVDVYYLALLLFIGCTADSQTSARMLGDEIAIGESYYLMDPGSPAEMMGWLLRTVGAGQPPLERARTLAAAMAGGPKAASAHSVAHCEVAQNLAGRLGFGPSVRQALGQTFERWDGKGRPGRTQGEALARPMRVVQLAQDAEVIHRLRGLDTVVSMVRQRAGSAYDPAVATRFCADAPALLAALGAESAWEAVLAAEPGHRPYLTDAQYDSALEALADFTDLKSTYTLGHSPGVAALAAEAGALCGMPAPEVLALRRAGLVHDLGRVGISVRVWEKPGPLAESERERVRLHAYYTERILARPQLLKRLGALAGLHHERLDGSGYHRGLPAAAIPPAARLLAAADVYHAMIEPRPHRPALESTAAADELRREARAGRLEPEAVDAVLAAAGHPVRARRHTWPAELTDREVEVLRLLARGLATRQIATRLAITEKTADHHIQHIYGKVGCSTRAAATAFALQFDLVGDAELMPA